jgi:hypothetical protein
MLLIASQKKLKRLEGGFKRMQSTGVAICQSERMH